MNCPACKRKIKELRLVKTYGKYKKLTPDKKGLDDCYLEEFKKVDDGHQYQYFIKEKVYCCPYPDCEFTLSNIKDETDAIKILNEADE